MKEEFRPIKGYEGLYEVSNLGNVRNVKTGRILKSFDNKRGYLTIRLSKNGKSSKFYIHRLVAEAFISNPNNYPVINHKDEIKTNNSIDNLEWCTQKYNINYGTRAIRQKETCIKNGYWYEDSEQHKKDYYQEHKDEYIYKLYLEYSFSPQYLYKIRYGSYNNSKRQNDRWIAEHREERNSKQAYQYTNLRADKYYRGDDAESGKGNEIYRMNEKGCNT